jgi:hypothetical protein
MGEAPHHYLIFETTGGFCGIAWNNEGITRFQLPTKSSIRPTYSLHVLDALQKPDVGLGQSVGSRAIPQ